MDMDKPWLSRVFPSSYICGLTVIEPKGLELGLGLCMHGLY